MNKDLQISSMASMFADTIEHFERRFLSRFYRGYVAKLGAQNRYFNVKGIVIQSLFALELQKVFIELELVGAERKEGVAQSQFADIWELLDSELPEHRVLAIVGKAGCGKTTMLQHVALLLAQRIGPGKRRDLIPLLLPLRKHITALARAGEHPPSLAEILSQEHHDLKPPAQWFEEKLTHFGHRCLVLLDGLDEVAEPRQRKLVAAWVQEQTQKYPAARFVVTSRPHGYSPNPIANATRLEVEDFNEKQIRSFVAKWYFNTEIKAAGNESEEVRRRAEEQARHLLHIVFQTEALARLALNPLLLTMITMVHRYVGHLPEARAALYEDIIKVLLGRREHTVIAGVKLSYYQKRRILQVLAFELMRENQRENQREIAAAEAAAIVAPALERVGVEPRESTTFLKAMMDESGLLLESNVGTLAFAHLTYQEFLAASEIKERNHADLLIGKLGVSWWHETTLLYAAMADVSDLVRACLERARNAETRDGLKLEDLKLAYEISQEAMQIEPSVRRELEALVILEAASHDVERQRLAAGLIFEIRLARMIRLRPGVNVDQYFISRLEYQAFIRATGRQPDHWSGWHMAGREGLLPISGVRRNDALAFAAWLSERAAELGHPRSRFRLPAREELAAVQINREPQDLNFKALANPNLGTWVNDDRALASEVEVSEADARAALTRSAGDQETRRMTYYAFTGERLRKLCDAMESLQREVRKKSERVMPDRLWRHAAFAREVEDFLDRAAGLKENYRALAAHARQIGFKLDELPRLEQLEVELNELSRMRFRHTGGGAYEEKNAQRILDLLVRAEGRLEETRRALDPSLAIARREHDRIFRILREELDAIANLQIDLDQHLDFLMQIAEPNLPLEEVRTLLQRAIGRDHAKAKAELLLWAEQALFANEDKMLKKILRGFWAVFIVEQRSLEKDALPTWEGIRLVREIKQREEEALLQ